MADYDDMTLSELQAVAEKLGIKQPGIGWPTCCPPNGNKADILKKLKSHGGGAGGGGKGGGGEAVDIVDLDDFASLRFTPAKLPRYKQKELKKLIEEEGLDEGAVKHMYTQNHIYKKLNEGLNQSTKVSLTKFQKHFTVLLGDAIWKIVEKLPKKVYRGMYLTDHELMEYKQAEGKTIYWYGFTSTSQSEEVARGFGNAFFEIELEKGNRDCVANMKDESQYPEEEEVLISANAGFYVEKVDLQKRRVRLLLVDNEHCPWWDA